MAFLLLPAAACNRYPLVTLTAVANPMAKSLAFMRAKLGKLLQFSIKYVLLSHQLKPFTK